MMLTLLESFTTGSAQDPLPTIAQKLAQEVIAGFTLYSDVSKKAHLLDLVDTLVVDGGDTFHRQLAEEGFLQMLISDENV